MTQQFVYAYPNNMTICDVLLVIK